MGPFRPCLSNVHKCCVNLFACWIVEPGSTRMLNSQPVTSELSPLVAKPPANDANVQAPLRIATLQDIGAAVWDAFVYREPTATFFHLSGWQRVVQKVYGFDTHYLAAVRDNRVVGVLPLVHVRSALFGNSLISNAYCVYGGIAGQEPDVVYELADAAARLANKLAVGYVELRSIEPCVPDWPVKSDIYATFQRPLYPSEQENLKAIPRKKRADVRKGMKNNLTIDLSGDLDAFYDIYAESVRNLGTPVFSKRFAAAIQQEFGDRCEVSLACGPDGPVAALMSFYFRDRVLPYYGGGSMAARPLHGYDQLYWTLMCRAVDRGATVFDFGRSKFGTGAFEYKKYWGFEPTALHYQYHLAKSEVVPDINPLNPKYRLMVAAWKKLPLFAAGRLGPWLSRQLG